MNIQDYRDDVNAELEAINLDYSHIHFEHAGRRLDARDLALQLSLYLTAHSNYAELAEAQEWPQDDKYELSGFGLRFQTQSHQWFALAGKLSHYGSYGTQDCWIGRAEYDIFQEIYQDLEYEIETKTKHHSWRGRGEQDFVTDTLHYVTVLLDWFRPAYAKHHPEFLFEVIKT